jgi:hypothetical protein
VRRACAALIAIAIATAPARADDTDAERALHAAQQHAAAGDPHALDELEALGAARPVTRWTDNAWSEAARLAERAGDYVRAQRDLEQVLATTSDAQIARRARGDLARLGGMAGARGEWAEVAAVHDRLEARLGQPGDPKPALAELEALVDAHPGYPRAAGAMIAIARGRERDGDADRALVWLARAVAAAPPGAERTHAQAEQVRALVRHGDLDAARAEIPALADPIVAGELREVLVGAELRRDVRWILAGVLAALAAAGVLALRRSAGSWRAAAHRLARPPAEVLFFAPIAVLLVIVASTGNPLIAGVVRAIAIAGVVVAWLSGAILESVRARRGRVGFPRAAGHAFAAVIAVASAAYIALDRDRVIDLVIETWREGPAPR